MGHQLILAHSERTIGESASCGLGGKGCIDGCGGERGFVPRRLLLVGGGGISGGWKRWVGHLPKRRDLGHLQIVGSNLGDPLIGA